MQPSRLLLTSRFIPAHAGNSRIPPHTGRPMPVHPRACGELVMMFPALEIKSGSSPRMRGTLLNREVGGVRRRFIPAHAGNSFLPDILTMRNPVHPRACGELELEAYAKGNGDRFIPAHAGNSSSDEPPKYLKVQDRFIPAHAGNSLFLMSSALTSPVHPRACGELVMVLRMKRKAYGSSPRMRGTLADRSSPLAIYRFIPAHAGNSRQRGPS